MAPDLIECPNCHATNDSSASQCTTCATPFPASDATFIENLEKIAPGDATHSPDASNPGNLTDLSGAQGWSQPLSRPTAAAFRGGRIPNGSRLGTRYEIVLMLGEGGMGSVYKARDLELDRFVALKVIRPEFALHEEVLRRFKQELILARKITHKNVIRIFDLGEVDGVKFITMEFIEGQDLSSLAKEKLSYENSAAIIYQACAALDAAHAEGVVHRDLKPQNIMVDKSGRVIVMDFGIARTTEIGAGMTNTGALIGTPDYMSPEQVMGEHVDARSDLFAMGIIFYQLLVGALPYKADTAQAAMFKRTREQSKRPVEVDPAVPVVLSDITTKCLQMDPALRYQSASEIQRDIDAWRGGSTKRIDIPVTTEPEKSAPPKSRTLMLWAAAALLLAVGGAFVGKKYFFPSGAAGTPAAALNSLAILPFHNASSDAKLDWLGSIMAEMLSTDVGQSASVRMVSTDRVGQVLKDLHITPQSGLDAPTVGRIANLSNVDTLVWGQYAQFGDHIRIDATIQDFKRGRTTTVKEDAASEKEILPAMDRLAAQIRANLSVSKSLQKELQEHAFKPSTSSIAALREYDQGLQKFRNGNYLDAVTRFQAAIGEDSQFALAYSKLAQSQAELGQDDEAEQDAQKAVSLSGSLPAQEKYLIQANRDRILKDYPKAIEAYQALVGVASDNADYLYELATAYESAGNYDKAKELFTKVVKLDPKRIEGLLALGRVEIESGNTQSGLEFLTRAQAMSIELSDEAGSAKVLQAMGVAYSSLQKPDEALKTIQESMAINTRLGIKKGAGGQPADDGFHL